MFFNQKYHVWLHTDYFKALQTSDYVTSYFTMVQARGGSGKWAGRPASNFYLIDMVEFEVLEDE